MSHITTEQALQIPQQLKKHGSHGGSTPHSHPNGEQSSNENGILPDDAVTILNRQTYSAKKKVEVNNFKSEIGADEAFVKETLRHKLAEYNLNPNTQITLKKDLFGNVELKGAILQTDIERMTAELNNSQTFKLAFDRLSQQKPTLNYVDNVVKLTEAYGVGNSLFNSIVSEENQFNQLQDLSNRYQALKASTPIEDAEPESKNYQITINA